jgi:REP element-mobilizing transposase RayT
MSGIIRRRGQTPLAINGTSDHVHLAIGLEPTIPLSDLVREIKSASAALINERHWALGRFHWQEGYGAFSFARSDLDSVVRYILNQEDHHRVKTFREEYLEFLQQYQIDYEFRYVFAPLVAEEAAGDGSTPPPTGRDVG